MSAPDTKAYSPALRNTMTRTDSSAMKSARIVGTASHISRETALCLAGLFKIIQPMPDSFLEIILSVMGALMNAQSGGKEEPCAPVLGTRTGEVHRPEGPLGPRRR